MRYRKKPIEIEAVHHRGDSEDTIRRCQELGWVRLHFTLYRDGSIGISTLEGEMKASPGDWIIKGISGEFYPCKPDIFDATYEPVSE